MKLNEKASVPVAAPSAHERGLRTAEHVYDRNHTYSDVRTNDGGNYNFGIE